MSEFDKVQVYTTSPDGYGGSYAGQDYTVYFVHPEPQEDGHGNILTINYIAHRGSNCQGRYHADGFDISRVEVNLTGLPPSAVLVTDEGLRESYRHLLKKKMADEAKRLAEEECHRN